MGLDVVDVIPNGASAESRSTPATAAYNIAVTEQGIVGAAGMAIDQEATVFQYIHPGPLSGRFDLIGEGAEGVEHTGIREAIIVA